MAINRPNGNRFERDIAWLKQVGAIDLKGERALKLIAKRYKRFLIVGALGSGKNTVADALSDHLHEIGKEPMILPTLEGRTLTAIHGSANWKKYKGLVKQPFPAVITVGYKMKEHAEAIEGWLERFSAPFDVVLDVRKLGNGRRAVFQILVRGQRGFRAIYRDKAAFRHVNERRKAA